MDISERQIGEISHEKTRTWQQMKNLYWETESLLTTAQNNASGSIILGPNSIRLNTTVWENCSISNYTRNWTLTKLPNGICPNKNLFERTKRIKFWDFEIQTDHLILARRPDLEIIYKKAENMIWCLVGFAVPADHRFKVKENENSDKYSGLAREQKSCGTWG